MYMVKSALKSLIFISFLFLCLPTHAAPLSSQDQPYTMEDLETDLSQEDPNFWTYGQQHSDLFFLLENQREVLIQFLLEKIEHQDVKIRSKVIAILYDLNSERKEINLTPFLPKIIQMVEKDQFDPLGIEYHAMNLLPEDEFIPI